MSKAFFLFAESKDKDVIAVQFRCGSETDISNQSRLSSAFGQKRTFSFLLTGQKTIQC
jgi:hypothetical protein